LRVREGLDTTLDAAQTLGGQQTSRLFAEIGMGDGRGSPVEPVDLHEVQARLAHPVPGGQRFDPLAGDESAGREKLPAAQALAASQRLCHSCSAIVRYEPTAGSCTSMRWFAQASTTT
jgi:hypothetical protein